MKLENKNLVECPHCHEMMMQHRVCPSCGYYDGKKVEEGIPDPFVESLQHDSIIVQIPLLHGRRLTRLWMK